MWRILPTGNVNIGVSSTGDHTISSFPSRSTSQDPWPRWPSVALAGGKLLIEVQRPFLLPPRFHGAPGVEAASRRTGQNSCADNELAGAPGEIRTPDPQIRSYVLRFFPSPWPQSK